MSGKEKYKREIAILFPYVSKKEKTFLHNFMQNIEDADYKDIVEEWGAPIAVVYSYIESQDTEIIIKELNRRRFIKSFLAVVLLFMTASLMIYTVYLNKAYQDVKKTIPDEIKETLVIEEQCNEGKISQKDSDSAKLFFFLF